MTIGEILQRLRVQKHAQPGRDNRCICPCHADKTGSLMVKLEDDGRILMHCQAGCRIEDVCNAIGVELSDLHERPLVPGMTVRNAKPTRKPKAPKPAPPPAPRDEKPERELPWPPTKIYDYTDEDGKLIFGVLRFTYRLPDVRVPYTDFGGRMSWIESAWPMRVNVHREFTREFTLCNDVGKSNILCCKFSLDGV